MVVFCYLKWNKQVGYVLYILLLFHNQAAMSLQRVNLTIKSKRNHKNINIFLALYDLKFSKVEFLNPILIYVKMSRLFYILNEVQRRKYQALLV